MDMALVCVLAAVVGLLSGLICVRLAAGGASRRCIAGLLIELWVVFALWVSVFALLSLTLGEPSGASWRAELADLSNRLSTIKAGVRYWLGAGIAAGLGACVHLLVRLRRAMGLHQLEVTGGEP